MTEQELLAIRRGDLLYYHSERIPVLVLELIEHKLDGGILPMLKVLRGDTGGIDYIQPHRCSV